MSPRLGKRAFKFFKFLLLSETFRFGGIESVEFFFGIAVFQFLGICFLFSEGSYGGESVCMTKYISAQTGTNMTTGKIYFGCLKLILVIIILF